VILCSCNVLSSTALRTAAERLRTADPALPVTPGRVFQALGVRPQCGSCVELVRRMLRDWGFPATCPEPLATIAGTLSGPDDDDEAAGKEWDLV
jgi:bacterioferritin-associated ferredoxin